MSWMHFVVHLLRLEANRSNRSRPACTSCTVAATGSGVNGEAPSADIQGLGREEGAEGEDRGIAAVWRAARGR
jgi:hypothetical protein